MPNRYSQHNLRSSVHLDSASFRQLRVYNSNQFYWRQHATATWILSLAQTKMEADYHGGPGMTFQIRSREE